MIFWLKVCQGIFRSFLGRLRTGEIDIFHVFRRIGKDGHDSWLDFGHAARDRKQLLLTVFADSDHSIF